MFSITQGKGFALTFANGWRISVQFGPGNYGDNYDEQLDMFIKPVKLGDWFLTSSTAEVAVMNPDGKFVPLVENGGNVTGYCSANEVANIIAETAART